MIRRLFSLVIMLLIVGAGYALELFFEWPVMILSFIISPIVPWILWDVLESRAENNARELADQDQQLLVERLRKRRDQ